MYKASGKKTAAEELTLEREGAGTSVQSGTKSYFLKQSQILIPRLHVLGERVNGSQINHLLLKKAEFPHSCKPSDIQQTGLPHTDNQFQDLRETLGGQWA